MGDSRTYSIAELQQLSGFDRRTIVYYIQQGLLPRPGRRGPRTRYPEEGLIRLRFVRGLKDLQDQGRCGTITLAEMRGLMARLDGQTMRALLERHLPPEEIGELQRQAAAPEPVSRSPEPASAAAATPSSRPTIGDGRRYGLADAGIRRMTEAPDAVPSPPPAEPAPLVQEDTEPRLPVLTAPPPAATDIPPEILNNLGELLRELELRPALSGRRLPPGAAEQWTEIPITSRVYLSIRGLSENDAPLADAAARALKKLLRAR